MIFFHGVEWIEYQTDVEIRILRWMCTICKKNKLFIAIRITLIKLNKKKNYLKDRVWSKIFK